MAITNGDRLVLRFLREKGLIPKSPNVLEIGKANWYGDIHPKDVAQDIADFSEGSSRFDPADCTMEDVWKTAEWYYDLMLRYPKLTAIDLDPNARNALRYDLNRAIPYDHIHQYDVVINTGTTEHVFDQGVVWETIHLVTKRNGIMIHSIPLWGWLDHGFFNYQPTMIVDLAAHNGYEIDCWFIHELKTNWSARVQTPEDFRQYHDRSKEHCACMHVAFRKLDSVQKDLFEPPIQGIYSNRSTHSQKDTWQHGRS